jgi:hypothetical protein
MLKNAVLHNTQIFCRLLFLALLTSCHQTFFFIKNHPVKLTLAYKIEISFVYRISKGFIMTCITFSEINVQTVDQIMEYRVQIGLRLLF